MSDELELVRAGRVMFLVLFSLHLVLRLWRLGLLQCLQLTQILIMIMFVDVVMILLNIVLR